MVDSVNLRLSLSHEMFSYFSCLKRAMRSPAFTTSPGLTKTFSTFDLGMLSGTSTLISNFIASRIETVCLAEISSPSETCIFHTLDAVGASMTVMAGSTKMRQYHAQESL